MRDVSSIPRREVYLCKQVMDAQNVDEYFESQSTERWEVLDLWTTISDGASHMPESRKVISSKTS